MADLSAAGVSCTVHVQTILDKTGQYSTSREILVSRARDIKDSLSRVSCKIICLKRKMKKRENMEGN